MPKFVRNLRFRPTEEMYGQSLSRVPPHIPPSTAREKQWWVETATGKVAKNNKMGKVSNEWKAAHERLSNYVQRIGRDVYDAEVKSRKLTFDWSTDFFRRGEESQYPPEAFTSVRTEALAEAECKAEIERASIVAAATPVVAPAAPPADPVRLPIVALPDPTPENSLAIPQPQAGETSHAEVYADPSKVLEGFSDAGLTPSMMFLRYKEIALYGEPQDSMKALSKIEKLVERACKDMGMAPKQITTALMTGKWDHLVERSLATMIEAGDMDAIRIAIASSKVQGIKLPEEGKFLGGQQVQVNLLSGIPDNMDPNKRARLEQLDAMIKLPADFTQPRRLLIDSDPVQKVLGRVEKDPDDPNNPIDDPDDPAED